MQSVPPWVNCEHMNQVYFRDGYANVFCKVRAGFGLGRGDEECLMRWGLTSSFMLDLRIFSPWPTFVMFPPRCIFQLTNGISACT